MYILEIINASTLPFAIKARLCNLVEQAEAALSEDEAAVKVLFESKRGMNERQYAERLSKSQPGAKRDELITIQVSWRNQFANSVYRAQAARRRMQDLGKALHVQTVELDISDPTAKTVAIALRSLIGRCTVGGGDTPNAIAQNLKTVADVSQETIEDAVREIFLQKKAGRGKYHSINFSSQPIMVTDADSAELRALWHANQAAEKLFYQVRANFDEFYSAQSKMNVPQFVARLEDAQKARDTVKFNQIVRERNAAEAEFYVAANHLVAVIMAYQSKIDDFAAVIKNAASTVDGAPRGNKQLSVASACIGAWHWLHEMQMQIDSIFRRHDPRPTLSQMQFDVEAYLAA